MSTPMHVWLIGFVGRDDPTGFSVDATGCVPTGGRRRMPGASPSG